MTVTLKDGSTIQAEQGEKIIDVTKRISEGLARNALIARMNGKLDLPYRCIMDYQSLIIFLGLHCFES